MKHSYRFVRPSKGLFLLLLMIWAFLAAVGQTTFARIKAPGHPNARAHVFVNGAHAITLAPVNNALVPDKTVNGKGIRLDSSGQAVIQVTSTLEPGIAANAQIHAKLENIPPSAPPNTSVSTHIDVLNYSAYQSVYNCLIGALGGDPEGISGMVGGFAYGLLVIGDAAALVKNFCRSVGWQEGNVDQIEVTLITIGLLATCFPSSHR